MQKKLAKVESVFFGKEGHGILTLNINLDYGDGNQSFGGIALGGKGGIDYILSMLELFGVDTLNAMIGRSVYALFDKAGFNRTISGLEMPVFDGGKQFITKEWQAKRMCDSSQGGELITPRLPQLFYKEQYAEQG